MKWPTLWRISPASTTSTWSGSTAKKPSAKNGQGADNLYGSRHLAERWRKDGTLARIKALINVDMIGDKKPRHQTRRPTPNPRLQQLIWSTAAELGYQAYFLNREFPRRGRPHALLQGLGVPALDIIDFDYGPDNQYWHTDQDTMDKLSAQSLEIVGTVVLEVIHRLET